MTSFDPKDPADIANFQLSWTGVLGGDTITALVSATVSPSTTPALVVESSSFTTTTTTAKLSGGKSGTNYVLTFRVTTAGSQTFERSALLRVRER